jgi:hypothetical protein
MIFTEYRKHAHGVQTKDTRADIDDAQARNETENLFF